jgi:nitrate reductase gamma subunit
MLIGVSMLLLAVGAIAILADPSWPREAFGTGITVGAFAIVFAVLGAVAVAWGAAHLWAGGLLRAHRPMGRVLTLALSLVNLLVLPFGTVMGSYALWILMTSEARHLFEAPAPTR